MYLMQSNDVSSYSSLADTVLENKTAIVFSFSVGTNKDWWCLV
jgi:hypothetical protein